MNELMKPPHPGMPGPGGWIWDGERWVCDPCEARPPWPPTHGPQPPFRPPWFDPPQPPWYPGANAGVSFGLTPPAHPVRGHFWYNGTNLMMFDGAAWVSIGGGTAGGGTPPAVNPPTNPQPGEQWFDGTTLWIWDGNAWVPVAGTKTFVQATAPPAPVPGDLWFDGTQLRVWSGSAWMLVGPGATVGPVPTTTLVFSITVPSNIPVASGNDEVLAFTSSPTVDTLNGWDPITKKYTPTKPGIYFFWAQAIALTSFFMTIAKNDGGAANLPPASVEYIASAGLQIVSGEETFSISGIRHMNGTTDYARLWVAVVTGAFLNFGSNPVFQVWLMP